MPTACSTCWPHCWVCASLPASAEGARIDMLFWYVVCMYGFCIECTDGFVCRYRSLYVRGYSLVFACTPLRTKEPPPTFENRVCCWFTKLGFCWAAGRKKFA